MTSSVMVNALHGWPVDVTTVDKAADGSEVTTTVRIAPGTSQTVSFWKGRDLRVHEVQPEEVAAEAAALQQAQEAPQADTGDENDKREEDPT